MSDFGSEDGIANELCKLVRKHPGLYYSIQLEDTHILRHTISDDLADDVFHDVYTTYNNALFDSLRLMVRYEKSLKAWREIIKLAEGREILDTLIMDYVHPIFLVTCDLPNVFKDQLVRGCVKLASVSTGDYSYLCDTRFNWFKEMKAFCAYNPFGLQLIQIVDDDLYHGDDATHFRDIHGNCMHDLSQTLVAGSTQTVSPHGGLFLKTHSKSFNLENELEIIDRHRRRIQRAYLLFGDYAESLSGASLESCKP